MEAVPLPATGNGFAMQHRRASQMAAVQHALGGMPRDAASTVLPPAAASAAPIEAKRAYALLEDKLNATSESLSSVSAKLGEALKALLPPDEPALLRSSDGSAPRRPERGGPPLAVTMGLKDLKMLAEQFSNEDSRDVLAAAASLRDRVEREVAERERILREERSAECGRARERVGCHPAAGVDDAQPRRHARGPLRASLPLHHEPLH